MNAELILNLLIALSLGGVTCYYGFKSWKKYNDNIAAISNKKVPTKSLNFPDITFCSLETKQGILLADQIRKLHANETFDNVEEWFYPREELFNIESDDNADNEENWHHFIDIQGGYCHTFHPSKLSAGHEDDFLLLKFWVPKNYSCLGDQKDIDECESFPKIFLHEEGCFLYRTGLEFLGITFEYAIPNRIVYAALFKEEKKLLNKDDYPCNDTLSQRDWVEQIQSYLENERQCSYPWKKDNYQGLPKCNQSQIGNRESLEMKLKYLNEHFIYQKTGILRPCSFVDYSIKKSKHSDPIIGIKKKRQSDMDIMIFYRDSFVDDIEEYLAFDFFSMVAEMGGLCGLFLGFSFYPIIMAGTSMLKIRLKEKIVFNKPTKIESQKRNALD